MPADVSHFTSAGFFQNITPSNFTIMKKIVCLFIIFMSFAACTPKDYSSKETIDLLAATSVAFPTTFEVDTISEISITYSLPNQCYSFYDFYYYKSDNNRTVAIQALNSNQDVCTQTAVVQTQILKFKPTFAGTYTFKFYKGKDDAGVDQYFTYQAVVN